MVFLLFKLDDGNLRLTADEKDNVYFDETSAFDILESLASRGEVTRENGRMYIFAVRMYEEILNVFRHKAILLINRIPSSAWVCFFFHGEEGRNNAPSVTTMVGFTSICFLLFDPCLDSTSARRGKK